MTKDKRKYADRASYLKIAVQKRRRLIRDMAIKCGGGQCALCGYNRCENALEFHHRMAKSKDFGISAKGYTRSWAMVKKEIDKCILLCANCHREVHEGKTQLPQVIEVEKQGEFGEAVQVIPSQSFAEGYGLQASP
ncbi:MAG: hypothetical protein Q7K39_00880 [Candidatus Magasanikbacteria bacterium]|nr:hypothetical protein [Candidatus Magasanikbacteria bacterium]